MNKAESYAAEAIAQALDGEKLIDMDSKLEEAQENAAEGAEVIYYADAPDVIDAYASEHGDEADDLCSGKEYKASDWLQARQDYANALLYVACGAECSKQADALREQVELFTAEVERLGGDPDEATFSTDCLYGWEAHNYETAEGVMVWSTERDSPNGCFNPSLLEGELIAVSFKVNETLWLNLAWRPEAGDESGAEVTE